MILMILVSPVLLCFRALDDIEESIKELEYYRQAIFKTCKWRLQLAGTTAVVLLEHVFTRK